MIVSAFPLQFPFLVQGKGPTQFQSQLSPDSLRGQTLFPPL